MHTSLHLRLQILWHSHCSLGKCAYRTMWFKGKKWYLRPRLTSSWKADLSIRKADMATVAWIPDVPAWLTARGPSLVRSTWPLKPRSGMLEHSLDSKDYVVCCPLVYSIHLWSNFKFHKYVAMCHSNTNFIHIWSCVNPTGIGKSTGSVLINGNCLYTSWAVDWKPL